MIVSHRHRFIFIKTQKVAGTSVEIALSKFLGPEDVVTPIVDPADEALRRRLGVCGPQNYRATLRDLFREGMSLSGEGRNYARQIIGGKWPQRYFNHIGAEAIRAAVGEKVWTEYFKFTIERNPFDKAVSAFFYYGRRRVPDLQFRAFVLSGEAERVSDFDKYALRGLPAMDFVARYETLASDLDQVGNRLGLDERLSGLLRSIRTKTTSRGKEPVATYYDKETRAVIEIQFARECRYFGYGFPGER
jgi:hypothetical protein